MEHTYDNCKHSKIEKLEDVEEMLLCGYGEIAFMECQCACTNDFFERK